MNNRGRVIHAVILRARCSPPRELKSLPLGLKMRAGCRPSAVDYLPQRAPARPELGRALVGSSFLQWKFQPFTWWLCRRAAQGGLQLRAGVPRGCRALSILCPRLPLPRGASGSLSWRVTALGPAWLQTPPCSRLPQLLSADNKISCDALMSSLVFGKPGRQSCPRPGSSAVSPEQACAGAGRSCPARGRELLSAVIYNETPRRGQGGGGEKSCAGAL